MSNYELNAELNIKNYELSTELTEQPKYSADLVIDLKPNKTSQLINDGADGIHQFLTSASIGNGVLTLKQDGQEIGKFSANEFNNKTITIPKGVSDFEHLEGSPYENINLKLALNSKQATISDLEEIRTNADKGATSIQPNDNITELTNNANYQNATQVTSAINTHNVSTTSHEDIRQTAEEALSRASQAVQSLVFDTVSEMQAYLSNVAHKGELHVGDNLYIKDVSVDDYWISAVLEIPDTETGYYYEISPLSGEKPNISNMVTTNDNQTITGDKNFTGSLTLNSENVATQSFVTSYHDTSKQDKLVSGTNIKTVNNNSLVGSGNISINEITSAERTKLDTVNTIFTKIGGSDIDYDLSTIECSKEGCTYGFTYGTYSYGGRSWTGLGSTNNGIDNTFSYGKITFNFAQAGVLKVTAYCNAESTYDFGILSNLDQELSKDATADTINKYSFSGHQGTYYTAEYEVSAGTHFITIKYRKDSSQSIALDRMVVTKIEFKTPHGWYVASYENPTELIEIGNTPEVPVEDVQMQTSTSSTTYTSILDGKIAKIPKATTSAMGVVQPSTSYGTTITSGYLGISSASSSEVQSKSSSSKPLTPSNIHDIIRYGLGTYSGTALTDAQKAKARETIGADDAGSKFYIVEWT